MKSETSTTPQPLDLGPTITTKEYLVHEIIKRENENVGLALEMRLATRMSLGNTSPTKFEQVAGALKAKIKANEEVIKLYTEWLAEEYPKPKNDVG